MFVFIITCITTYRYYKHVYNNDTLLLYCHVIITLLYTNCKNTQNLTIVLKNITYRHHSTDCGCLSVVVAKVTELKSLANHVVVGSVSCETLDLFCPLPQTVAVDINDLGTVKLNLEVNWRSVSPQSSLFTTSSPCLTSLPCLTSIHLNPCSTFIYLPILSVIAKPGHL